MKMGEQGEFVQYGARRAEEAAGGLVGTLELNLSGVGGGGYRG